MPAFGTKRPASTSPNPALIKNPCPPPPEASKNSFPRVIADYGVNALGEKKWAIVHSTDAFGTNGMKNLVEVLKRTGVEPALNALWFTLVQAPPFELALQRAQR